MYRQAGKGLSEEQNWAEEQGRKPGGAWSSSRVSFWAVEQGDHMDMGIRDGEESRKRAGVSTSGSQGDTRGSCSHLGALGGQARCLS